MPRTSKRKPQIIRIKSVSELPKLTTDAHFGDVIVIEYIDFSSVAKLTDLWQTLQDNQIKIELVDTDWLTDEVLQKLFELRQKQKSDRVKSGMIASGKPLGRPANEENKQKAVEEYLSNNGLTVPQIAKKHHISTATLYRALTKYSQQA